ncbi:MAG TPA: hypothetical protein VLX92_21245 [Kofleriaceae bacterium]|nr:hypothetical protein [Kofleriaceae bacterium]
MSKLRTVLLTAAVAFPIGIMSAGPLRGHPNLERARNALDQADMWIGKSQAANEGVWKDEAGHGQKAKELIGQAKEELRLAAEWVNHH